MMIAFALAKTLEIIIASILRYTEKNEAAWKGGHLRSASGPVTSGFFYKKIRLQADIISETPSVLSNGLIIVSSQGLVSMVVFSYRSLK